MNTRQLIQFAAVASAGAISEGAKRLNMAQPALSHAIATLEADLGVTLFERRRRGVELTEAGRVLQEHARSILQQLEVARESVRDVGARPRGKVSVALPASVAHVLVKPFGARMLREYPSIEITFEEGLTGTLIRWLRSGRTDFMVDFDVEDGGDLACAPLIEEDLYLFGVGLGTDEDIRFCDLPQYPLFLPGPEHAMSRALTRYEHKGDITLARAPLRAAVHPMLALVRAGLGYSISPWSLIGDKIGDGLQARRIVEPHLRRRASLVFSRTRTLTTAARIVRDVLCDAVRRVHAEGLWRGALLVDHEPNDSAPA